MKILQEVDLQSDNFISLSEMKMPGNNQGDPDKEEKPITMTTQEQEDEKKGI